MEEQHPQSSLARPQPIDQFPLWDIGVQEWVPPPSSAASFEKTVRILPIDERKKCSLELGMTEVGTYIYEVEFLSASPNVLQKPSPTSHNRQQRISSNRTSSNFKIESSLSPKNRFPQYQPRKPCNIMATQTLPPPTNPHNYSLQAIPAAFLFGLVPHAYGLTRLMVATRNAQSNAMYAFPFFPFPSSRSSHTSIHPCL